MSFLKKLLFNKNYKSVILVILRTTVQMEQLQLEGQTNNQFTTTQHHDWLNGHEPKSCPFRPFDRTITSTQNCALLILFTTFKMICDMELSKTHKLRTDTATVQGTSRRRNRRRLSLGIQTSLLSRKRQNGSGKETELLKLIQIKRTIQATLYQSRKNNTARQMSNQKREVGESATKTLKHILEIKKNC